MNKVTFFLAALAFTGITSRNKAYSQTIIDQGTCGANLTWVLRSNGTLTISGNGAMDNYSFVVPYMPICFYPPWWVSYHSLIKTVRIGDSVTTIGDDAFKHCDNLTSVTIGNSITTIGYSAFLACTSLISVTIPNSVTAIGNYAFGYCSGLTSVTIPNSVTTIEDYAFYNCNRLTSITIPNSVTTIGYNAFYNCTRLNSIICEAITPPVTGVYTFENVPKTIPVFVPCKSMNVYQTTNYWNVFTNFIGIPDTTFIFDSICLGSVYYDNGFTIYNGAGIYYRTETIDNNCDSVICLTLSEYFLPITHYSASFCQGGTYSDDNFTTLTQTGIYYDTLQNGIGCDSIVCLNLSYYPAAQMGSYSAIICQGESYSDTNFTNLTDHGIYYATLQNVNGCDSVVQFFLTVYRIYIEYDTAIICQGESYDFHGKNYTESGTYRDTLQSIRGCDSIIELKLTVNPTYLTQIRDSVYTGDSYNFFGKLLTTDGIYYDTLRTIFGCDSVIELTLTVTGVGIVETGRAPSLPRIYPNPTTGKLKIESGELKIENIMIFDVVGRTVGAHPCGRLQSETTIDISHLSNGIYFIKINEIVIKVSKSY